MGRKSVEIEELDGWWLDYVVGQQVCGRKPHIIWAAGGSGLISIKFQERGGKVAEFSPHSNWSDAGPLIEQFKISLKYDGISGWIATVEGGKSWTDFSPLLAAMRALIASKIDGECYIPTYM
ncbi:phage protein NinX family protein [Pseudomonas alliivorans]|nr:phage protein NinX family protein [Pseudomonas alliivorans]